MKKINFFANLVYLCATALVIIVVVRLKMYY